MTDKKITQMEFAEVMRYLLKDKDTETILNKTFQGKVKKCQSMK